LSPLIQTFNDDEDLVVMVEQMINKLQFIAKMHGLAFDNVNQDPSEVEMGVCFLEW